MKFQVLLLLFGSALLFTGVWGISSPSNASQAERLFSRATPDDFMGNEGCESCHEEKVAAFAASGHAPFMADPKLPLNKRGCEGCHGPGEIHQAEEDAEVIAFRKMTPKESSAACMRCHAETMSPNHWKGTAHARADVSCVSCHQIHPDSESGFEAHAVNKGGVKDARTVAFVAKKDPRALLKADEATVCGQCHTTAVSQFRLAHRHPVPEGRMACSDCHSVHPSKASKLDDDALKGKCVTCHTEKAGPFVYEHDPVAGFTGDGCVECHKPHGANNPKMLVATTRGLCSQCHSEKLSGHYPGRSCWSAGCHVASHGSNNDPRLLRP